MLARSCGEACDNLAVVGVRNHMAWTAPLVAATRARCEAGGRFGDCVSLFRALDPRTDGRTFYAAVSGRAAQACTAGDLVACTFFDFSPDQAKRLGASPAALQAARANALSTTLALCTKGNDPACDVAADLTRSVDDEQRLTTALCTGRPCRAEASEAACDNGNAQACALLYRPGDACRFGDKASCFALVVDAPSDTSVLKAACRTGAQAACTLLQVKSPATRLTPSELEPPTAAVFEEGDEEGTFGVDTGPSVVCDARVVFVRTVTYRSDGVLENESISTLSSGIVPRRRRTWVDAWTATTAEAPQKGAPVTRVVDVEVLVVADQLGAVQR